MKGKVLPGSPSTGVRSAAERLLAAVRSRTPCAPVRDVLPDGSAETAYAVQTL
jgi:2-keto-4-pentenoate hydratase